MNKNVLIGILAAVVIIIGGYFVLQHPSDEYAETPAVSDATPASVDSNPTPPAPAPTPNLTMGQPKVETSQNVNASISTALVNGQVIPNGVPTMYWFEYGFSDSFGSKTSKQQIGSGFSPIAAPGYITGLKSNTVYYYRLSASNNFGTVSGATYNFKTTNNPAPVASVPSAHSLAASDVSRDSAKLNGQINPNGWETTYWFEYGKDINMGNVNSVGKISDSGSIKSTSTVAASLSGLEPLTKYFFRVNAQNQFGTVNGSTMSFLTKGPINPGDPTVTTSAASNITKTGAQLNGKVNPNGADSTYWFEYSEDSLLGNIIGSGTPVQSLNAGNDSITIKADANDLNTNTKYYYRLVSKNQYGTKMGSIMSFTTKK